MCHLSLFSQMFLNGNYVPMSTFEFDVLNWVDKLVISIMTWKQVNVLVSSVLRVIFQKQYSALLGIGHHLIRWKVLYKKWTAIRITEYLQAWSEL